MGMRSVPVRVNVRRALVIVLLGLAGCSTVQPKVQTIKVGPTETTSDSFAQCPVVKIAAVGYGQVRSNAPDDLVDAKCVAEPRDLDPSQACASAATEAARKKALANAMNDAGLHTIDRPILDSSTASDVHGSRRVHAGSFPGCPQTPHSLWGGIQLAADADGRIVVLQFEPITESRIYPGCGCADTCGGAEEPGWSADYVLEEGESVDRVITVSFPALWVEARGIEDCPPMP